MKRQPIEIKREWYSAAEVGQIFGFTADTVLKGRAGFDALPRTLFGTKFHRFHRDDVEAFKRRMVERSTSLQAEREAEGRLFRWSPAVEVFAHHSTPARSPLSGRFGALPGASPTVRWGHASPPFHTLPHQAKL